jgi:hypothetical protein
VASRAGTTPELTALLRTLVAQGWVVTKTRSSHFKCVPPDPSAKVVYCSSTPGDWRAMANMRAWLRRSGAKL